MSKMDGQDSRGSARWWVLVVFVLLVVAIAFFWWQNQRARVVQTGVTSPAASVQMVGPTVSTRSVPDFPVGKAVSQAGTLQGPLAGSCGNIAWRDLSPQEVQDLRKLCPREAPPQH
ncbi:MAG: hypothetical protein ACP5D5_04625 [Acidithiobacillus sp.]|uniref:hypothetical protein n=1 Tax=Acidithiobacillus sp. TaxID=1872118 RepID=UPI003CFE4EE6